MISSVNICISCGKEMPAFYKGCSKTYDPKFHKNIYVCSNKCKEKWENQYFVEKYKEILFTVLMVNMFHI